MNWLAALVISLVLVKAALFTLGYFAIFRVPTVQCPGGCDDDCRKCCTGDWDLICDECRWYCMQDAEAAS